MSIKTVKKWELYFVDFNEEELKQKPNLIVMGCGASSLSKSNQGAVSDMRTDDAVATLKHNTITSPPSSQSPDSILGDNTSTSAASPTQPRKTSFLRTTASQKQFSSVLPKSYTQTRRNDRLSTPSASSPRELSSSAISCGTENTQRSEDSNEFQLATFPREHLEVCGSA